MVIENKKNCCEMSENIIPLEKLKFIINNIENHITKSDEPSRGNLSFLFTLF